MNTTDVEKRIREKIGSGRYHNLKVWQVTTFDETFHVQCGNGDLRYVQSVVDGIIKEWPDGGQRYASIRINEFSGSHQSFCFKLNGNQVA